MCWIIITPNKNDIKTHLDYQNDRWLDSIWIINKKNIYKAVKANKEWYNHYIDNIDNINWLYLIHHRKASIWDINLNNTHPFLWKHFIIIQNGTMKKFHKESNFNKDVDSHNLLLYIEKNTKSIYNIPKVLKKFKENFKDDYWILVLADYKWNIIFISDWGRESYIKIEENKIALIRNYKEEKQEWYKNIWYIIFNFDWVIEKQKFELEINSKEFKEKNKYWNYDLYNYWKYTLPLYKEKQNKIEEENTIIKTTQWAVEWEITAYLREKSELLLTHSTEYILKNFLKTKYWVKNINKYYNKFKIMFPFKFFKEEFDNIKNEVCNFF